MVLATEVPGLTAALQLAAAGLFVGPVCEVVDGECVDSWRHTGRNIGKAPLTSNGVHGFTNNPDRIRQLWATYPRAGVAIDLERSGLIDIAPDSETWHAEFLRLGIPSGAVRFDSGGGPGHEHFLVHRPPGRPARRICKPGEYDILSSGYSVVPPSTHANGHRRAWTVPLAERDFLPDAPAWVVAMLNEAATVQPAPPAHPSVDRLQKPPVRLRGEPREWWDGHKKVLYEDGTVDRSRTLWHIGLALKRANASRSTIIAALQDRDVALGYAKYADRKAAGLREYAAIADKLLLGTDGAAVDIPTIEDVSTSLRLSRIGNASLESLDDWLNGEDAPLDVVLGDGAEGAILPIDGKGFIAGSTGIGKTNLLLRFSRCLAEGSPFIGFPIPQPRRVLHVALEGSRRGLRRRLRKVWRDADADAKARYRIVLAQLNLTNAEGVEEIGRLIQLARAEVVIIDPLRNAHTWDENSSQEMAELTSSLDRLITTHGCAIVGAHHDRKKPPLTKRDVGTDRMRGSTALAGWLSFCLSIEKDPKVPDQLIAEWTKARDAEDGLPDLELAFDREEIDYRATERKAGSKVSDDDVLTPVFHSGHVGMRGTELFAAVRAATGAGERTVKDRVRELVKDGRLIEFVADEDRRTKAKSYRVPDWDGEED